MRPPAAKLRLSQACARNSGDEPMADDNESTPLGTHSHGGRPHGHGVKREDTHGSRTLEALANISQTKQGEKVKRSLELGLEAADSINDRTISLFSR